MSYQIAGVRLAVAQSNTRYKNRNDLLLIEAAEGSSVAASFTLNKFCAAPVTLAKEHLATTSARYLLINAGNANAGTGSAGYAAAVDSCQAIAELTGVPTEAVLPFSTGVIGVQLPVAALKLQFPTLVQGLQADNWSVAAQTIMTTDTKPKLATRQIQLSTGPVKLIGIAKGSGMICPNMATMLGYIATDARVEPDHLQALLTQAVNLSFNCISVDGDTSTNDACVLIASGQASATPLAVGSDDERLFVEALTGIAIELAQLIVRDGEGATKFISVEVSGGRDLDECRAVAYTVAHSPLIKTAFFASDPNWGRILAAVGRAPVDDFDLSNVSIALDEVALIEAGEPHPAYTEEQGQRVMQQADIRIRIGLGRGEAQATIWTCDFSHDYVTINASYRS